MRDAEGHTSQNTLHLLISKWVGDQVTHCLSELSQILLDKAMNDRNPEAALLFFKQHKHLENQRSKIVEQFHQLTDKALRDEDPSIRVIPQQRTPAELGALLAQLEHQPEAYAQCNVLREEIFTTLFQRAFNLLDPPPVVREIAREVFQREFTSQLALLHFILREQLATPHATTNIDRRSNIQAWITHLETKLRDASLDATSRSLAKAQLDELQTRIHTLDQLSQSAKRLRDRWYHPYEELAVREYSDEELNAEVDALFRPLQHIDSLPRSLKALAARIKPIMHSVALADRGSFMQGLHPARQLATQVVATVEHWEEKSAQERRQMLFNVHQTIEQGIGTFEGDEALLRTLRQEILDYIAYQMHRVERDEQESQGTREPRQSISFLDDINERLESKLEGNDVPPLVHKLVFSLWNRVIAELWLEYGEESITTQQALSLVDDILWYLHCDDRTLSHTYTEFLGEQIEHDLLSGLKLIDYNRAKGVELISSLRRLRRRLHDARADKSRAERGGSPDKAAGDASP